MAPGFVIQMQQIVEDISEFEFDNNATVHALCQWKGRSKVPIKRLKDQARRDGDLSMQG